LINFASQFSEKIVSNLSEFGITIRSLENKEYVFDFPVNDSFWGNFENAEISHGDISCKAVLNKTSSFIRVSMLISGTVDLVCDRSLDPFLYPIDIKGEVIFKFGEEDAEIDDEIFIISRNRQEINLAQSIYDLVSTAIPMKKLHPRFNDDPEEPDELVYSTENDIASHEEETETIDPRWEALKKLKKKK
jgi:uncharacterized protein